MRFDASFGGYELTVWSDRNPALPVGQDAWTVSEFPDGRLRAVVLDGVTPGIAGEWRLGLDQAVYAAALTRATLQADAPLAVCLARAHTALFEPTIELARYRPQTTAVAADLHADGHVELVCAGDSEAWTRGPNGWQPLFPGDVLTADARARFSALVARRAQFDLAAFIAQEAALLAAPADWQCTPIGGFERLLLSTAAAEAPTELVLASDGALLDPARLGRLDAWMKELRDWERAQNGAIARIKRSDDVTVLRLSRSNG